MSSQRAWWENTQQRHQTDDLGGRPRQKSGTPEKPTTNSVRRQGDIPSRGGA